MKDFTNTWKKIDIELDDNSFFDDKDDSFCMPLFENSDDVVITKKDLIEMRERHIKEAQEINKQIVFVAEVFGVSVEKLKQVIPYNSYIISCKKEELVDKHAFYKNLFGGYLLEIINADHIDRPPHYNGFFAYKNKYLIKDKVAHLQQVFNLSFEQIVRFLCYSSYYFYLSEEVLDKEIFYLKNFLDISDKELVDLFVKYPKLIEFVSISSIEHNTKSLSSYFECSIEEIKSMYKRCPRAFAYTAYDINSILRYNRNRTKDNLKGILKNPWVIECLTWERERHDLNYCGLRSLPLLLNLAEAISCAFGKVV